MSHHFLVRWSNPRAAFIHATILALGCAALGFTAQPLAVEAEAVASAEYEVSHRVVVKDLPADAETIRLWFWIPDDDAAQSTASLTINDAPADYLIVREPNSGSRFLFVECAERSGPELVVDTQFKVERRRISIPLNESTCGKLTAADRQLFANDLRPDTPRMEVTDEILAIANEVCGNEDNVVRQVRALYTYVVDQTDHYSKSETAPKSSGIGSAEYCLAEKGGGCTDQHALFIALARARGIPARLSFGSRLQDKNEGKTVDPGYRCWVEYYVPSAGWIPMDCSAGDTVSGMRDFYCSGLDENRIRFSRGRNFQLEGAEQPVDYFTGAYVEVDGKVHQSVERQMNFTRLKTEAAAK